MIDFRGVLLGTFCLKLNTFCIKCEKLIFMRTNAYCHIFALDNRTSFILGLKDAEVSNLGGCYSEHFALIWIIFA